MSSELEQRFIEGQLSESDKQEMLSWKITPYQFLKKSPVKIVDTKYLQNCEAIDNAFLHFCSELVQINFLPMTKINKVGWNFLFGCSALRVVDFSGCFTHVTSVGASFLQGCSNLEQVNLQSFSASLKNVAGFFLHKCPKLTRKEHLDQVDLFPMIHLQDGNILVDAFEDQNNNLKTALQRVRTGGVNGPKFVASSFSARIAEQKNEFSSCSSGVASASDARSSSSVCENCKKLQNELECSKKEIAKLKQEKEGEKQRHVQLVNKQAERLRELTKEKQKLEADLKKSEMNSSGVAPEGQQQQHDASAIQKMSVSELCSFLETRGTPPKILSILKEDEIVGREFLQPNFLVENEEDLFSAIRKTARQSLKELHAELIASSSSTLSSSSSSSATSATSK